MQKKCPRCGKTFDCVHSATCWCVTTKLTESARKFLKDNYNDCLCCQCLTEIAKRFSDD